MLEICLKLTVKIPERRVFIASLQISHIVLVFLLLTLKKEMAARLHVIAKLILTAP